MMRKLLLIAAVVLIIAFGVWEARWTDRWSSSHEPEEAAAKLKAVPLTVGDWAGKDYELDPKQVARAEITGYILRAYTHKKSGKVLQVLLVAGRAGPTSLHPPDICYQGAGYNKNDAAVKQAVKLPVGEPAADFWSARFQKAGATPDPLRIYWSWSATGAWVAADNPRWTFGSYPFLYKLYVIHPLAKLDEPAADDPAPEFLGLFLPELRKSLFP